MSNLGRSQADWRKLFRELGIFVAPQRELREIGRRFDVAKTRTRVLELGDANESTSGWSLSGARIGSNTDEGARVFVRIAVGTPAAGQAQVLLFRAAGGGAGDLVAQGAGALGAVIALAPQNGSGLSASVTIAAGAASEADDKHRLLVFPDWAARMHAVFDGSEPEHGELLEAFMTALAAAAKGVASALTAFETATDTYLSTRWKSFQRSSQSSPIQQTTEEDQGAIATVVSGLLEDGRDNMRDELVAGRQALARTVVAVEAPVFDPTNKGKGSLAALSVMEWARSGRITGTCSAAAIGAEQFTLAQHVDATGEDLEAKNPIQIRRAYSDPELGITSAFLDRVVTLDVGTADDFGPIGGWTIQGESDRNTDAGQIALRIVGQAKLFTIEGYSSTKFDPATKVFTTAPGAAGASVALLVANGSGLSGTAKLGANPTDGHTGLLNLNPFALGDKFVIDVALTARGAFQEELALLYGFSLESDDPAKATIPDDFVTAGTLPPFEGAP